MIFYCSNCEGSGECMDKICGVQCLQQG